MKVLIIDNTIDLQYWGSTDLSHLVHQNGRIQNEFVTTCVRRAPHFDLPPDPAQFDRIIVSGSKTGAADSAPWIDALLEFIKKTVQLGIPYLGVCYGHQMLVRALGGLETVRKAKQPEFGWIEIRTRQESILTRGLPKSFYSFASHYDETFQIPSNFKILAESDRCSVQACQLENLPIFGIQFHPEKTGLEGEKSLAEKSREKNHPPLINQKLGHKFYQAKVGKLLFNNFLNSTLIGSK